jgi:hypothetical protein
MISSLDFVLQRSNARIGRSATAKQRRRIESAAKAPAVDHGDGRLAQRGKGNGGNNFIDIPRL